MGDLVQEVYLKAYQSVAEASNWYGHYAISEGVFKVNSSGPEPFEHEMSHININPTFSAFSEFFVIFADPSVSPQPSQGALHMRPTYARKSESHP